MYFFSHIPAFPIINTIIKSAYFFSIRLLEAVYCLKVLMYCLVLRVDYLKRKRTLDQGTLPGLMLVPPFTLFCPSQHRSCLFK